MAKRRSPRILFFTQDAKPTEAEHDYADDLGANVGFRHGRIAASATKPEVCDGVAAIKGALIPMAYARADIPRVKNIADVNRLKPHFGRGDIGYTDDDDEDTVLVPGNGNGEPTAGGDPNVAPIAGDGSGTNSDSNVNDDLDDEEDGHTTVDANENQTPPAGPPTRTRRRGTGPATPAGAGASLLSAPPPAQGEQQQPAPASSNEPPAAPAWAPPPATPGT